MKKTLLLLGLVLLTTLVMVPPSHATVYTWNADPYLLSNTNHQYWDVVAFQWGDPDTTYASGSSISWQNGLVTIWVKDNEGDNQGTTVGSCRQGSPFPQSGSTPWYDLTSYQPTPLHFSGKSSVKFLSTVRIDSQNRYDPGGWINWLFNPWFKVQSTYGGVTKERLVVWDIVWAWSSWLGFPFAFNWVGSDESLHLAFSMSDMAQTGQWKTYVIDFLDMAQQAKQIASYWFGWNFNVEDLYLWRIDDCVEGYNYDSKFSIETIMVEYEVPSPPPPPGCPYVSVWDGSQFRLDNNILPSSETAPGDVVDYYKLRTTPIAENGKYSLLLSEFEQEHSYIDQVQLLAVDHEKDVNVAVTPTGEILTYKQPTPPITAINRDGDNITGALKGIDSAYYQGYKDDYISLDFGKIEVSNGAKLVIRSDMPIKSPINIQTINSSGDWNTVATIWTRTYWTIDIVNLSPYLPDKDGELKVRLFFVSSDKIDFVGLDTSKQENLELHYAKMVSATHSVNGNVRSALLEKDSTYSEIIPGQSIELLFTIPQNSEEFRSFIIVVSGRYTTQ